MNKHVKDAFTAPVISEAAKARMEAEGHHVRPPSTAPSLLAGTFGASEATQAAAAALEALILRAEAMGTVHTAYEVELDDAAPATLAAEEVWQSALEDVADAALAILGDEPTTPADARARLTVFLRASVLQTYSFWHWPEADLSGLTAMIGRLSEAHGGDAPTELGEALQYALTHDICITRQDDRWEAALAAFRSAEADYAAHQRRSDQAWADVYGNIPDCLREDGCSDRQPAWISLRAFDEDRRVSPRLRDDLRRTLEAWLAGYEARREAADLDQLEAEGDRLYEAWDAAYDALVATPAPDAHALMGKVKIQSVRIDDDRKGFDDPALVSQQLHSYLPKRALVQVFMDLRRMAGETTPLEGADFNPRAWIKAYEAAGGGVQQAADYTGLLLGRAFACRDKVRCRELEDELYATPWKARAVLLEVAEDRYITRSDATSNEGRFSWVHLTNHLGEPLTPRIHFALERDDRGPSSGPDAGGEPPVQAAA
jgi:hypothetical protein